MTFKIPENVDFVLKTLEQNGHEAYLVGGCVRDLFCFRTPDDFDITTSALPNQVQALFERTVSTGIKHGTVTVIVGNTSVEVTTYRTEFGYSDSRRPDGVHFVSDIEKDLSRRDFTVNAICYNPRLGLIDLFGGREDIAAKRLCCVGEPERRFKEDALRVLRLFRFASTLGFTPENNSAVAAINCSKGLMSISRERIANELSKAFCGKNPGALKPLIDCGGLSFLGITKSEGIELTARLLPKVSLRAYAFLRLASENGGYTLEVLKAPGVIKKYYAAMLASEAYGIPKGSSQIKRFLRDSNYEIFCDRMEFLRVISGENPDDAIAAAGEILRSGEAYKISQLNIGGRDVTDAGYSGEEIGNALNRLLEAVIENPELNTPENLKKLL